ncbi:DNA polymerase III subunit [Poriferisphaera corsica]|nr:DNA polymerase III subunit [Poriferisphaera corsica]
MDRIQGQSKVVGVLDAALMSGKLHHAYMFHGPVGVGKYSTAVEFAKVVLCLDPVTDLRGKVAACGACKSCQLFKPIETATFGVDEQREQADHDERRGNEGDDEGGLKGAHPDLHVVVKELARYSDDANIRNRKLTSIPVQVIQEAVLDKAYKKPVMGKGKVFIIDEAELMNAFGQNAILKTLEEPAPGSVFILVTSSEDRLLPTIRSRCQRIGFVPLGDDVVRRWLERHEAEVMRGLDDEMREWLIGFSGGSLGRAELVVKYGLFEWAREVLPRIEGIATGRADGELGGMMAGMVDAFAKAWCDGHDGASKEAANKMGAGLMWGMVAEHARRQMMMNAEQVGVGDLEQGENVMEPWARVIEYVTEAEELYRSNVKIDMVCDHLVMKMTQAIYRCKAVGS